MSRLVLLILASLAIWIMNRRPAGPPQNRPARPAPPGGTDPDEEERTRRVREMVLRRIQERRAEDGPPVLTPRVFEEAAPEPEPIPAQPTPAFDQAAAVLATQQRLAEQIRALEKAEATPAGPTPVGPTAGRPSPYSDQAAPALASFDLKRAVIWREILGPPVGLRQTR